jgi:hypothetical protein
MKITVSDLMGASGRGIRYNEGKLRYDLIPAKANEEITKINLYDRARKTRISNFS